VCAAIKIKPIRLVVKMPFIISAVVNWSLFPKRQVLSHRVMPKRQQCGWLMKSVFRIGSFYL
jgi:hypothetical protein